MPRSYALYSQSFSLFSVATCTNCGHDNRERAKFCEECGAALPVATASNEQRKIVTVLFCDLAGSTELGEATDPEALRALLATYFERMKAIVESHGGSVEKFIGDAVMAVFGVPLTHEDDALRGCRAAVEMRDAMPGLGLEARIGVNTGEVVTGTEERLATGDAVNVAARLEQAAGSGEILIGESTFRLVRDVVEAEAVEPLDLKGKSERVSAHRLESILDVKERSDRLPFVGRQREVELIHEAWRRARNEKRCELVTIVGDAGIGKSRLLREALPRIDARLVRGRCLPYGEGITYWPVTEVLRQLDVLPSDPAAAAALRSLLGETKVATSAEEIAWAFRKLLIEQVPLICLFDDIQWAEETFLDLVESAALLSSGGPILLLCTSRPELLSRRSEWPVSLRLEPLPAAQVDDLIGKQLPPEFRVRVAQAAGGNPLFLTEMLAMAAEKGEVDVPPTLRALLQTRLDQLAHSERRVLERGAVEGEIFHRGAVQALDPEEPHVSPRLAALVRRELIRPTRTLLPGEDAFRFRHLLIRDTAYDALPKLMRAELHEQFALWLKERAGELVEIDEILGHHLEQACRYRVELGLPIAGELRDAARSRLLAAGRSAVLRNDHHAAVSFFRRAAALVPDDEIDLSLEMELSNSLFHAGEGDEASRRARELAERGETQADRVAELCGRIREGWLQIQFEPEGATDRLEATIAEAMPLLEAAGDHVALFVAYEALSQVANTRARMDGVVDAHDRAAAHAAQAGLPYKLLTSQARGRLSGRTPVSELLAWIDERDPAEVGASMQPVRAEALAMLTRFEEARAILAEQRTVQAERGRSIDLAGTLGFDTVGLELLAGDYAAAVRFGLEGCRLYEELGERSYLSGAAALLGQAYYGLGDLDQAESWAARSREHGASDDLLAQMLWRQVQAKVLARRGAGAEAEGLAREAVAVAEQTDMLDFQALAYADLGEVLELVGRVTDAAEAFKQALARFTEKENFAQSTRVRVRLDALRATPA
jgi:class 3 adenylate cyclase/tetratricopeptide (TPR) repeat protein